MVKTSDSHCRGHRFSPWSGKIPQANRCNQKKNYYLLHGIVLCSKTVKFSPSKHLTEHLLCVRHSPRHGDSETKTGPPLSAPVPTNKCLYQQHLVESPKPPNRRRNQGFQTQQTPPCPWILWCLGGSLIWGQQRVAMGRASPNSGPSRRAGACRRAKLLQWYPTLCDPMDHSLGRLLCPWGFSRQKYWSAFPCPPPGDLPSPGIELSSHVSCIDSRVLCH